MAESELSKVSQSGQNGPLGGHNRSLVGHKQQKCQGDHNLKFILDIVELVIKSKKWHFLKFF